MNQPTNSDPLTIFTPSLGVGQGRSTGDEKAKKKKEKEKENGASVTLRFGIFFFFVGGGEKKMPHPPPQNVGRPDSLFSAPFYASLSFFSFEGEKK